MIPKVFIVAIFTSLLVFSCATIPKNDGNQGGLAIIPTIRKEGETSNPSIVYYAEIKNYVDDSLVLTMPISVFRDFTLISNLQPGHYYVAGYFVNFNGSKENEYATLKDSSHFVIQPGGLTITDFCFKQLEFPLELSCVPDFYRIQGIAVYDRIMERYPNQVGTWEILGLDS